MRGEMAARDMPGRGRRGLRSPAVSQFMDAAKLVVGEAPAASAEVLTDSVATRPGAGQDLGLAVGVPPPGGGTRIPDQLSHGRPRVSRNQH